MCRVLCTGALSNRACRKPTVFIFDTRLTLFLFLISPIVIMAQNNRFKRALEDYAAVHANTETCMNGLPVYDKFLFDLAVTNVPRFKEEIAKLRAKLKVVLDQSGIRITSLPTVSFSHASFEDDISGSVDLRIDAFLDFTLSNYMDARLGTTFMAKSAFKEGIACKVYPAYFPDKGATLNKIVAIGMLKSTEHFDGPLDYLEKKGVPSF